MVLSGGKMRLVSGHGGPSPDSVGDQLREGGLKAARGLFRLRGAGRVALEGGVLRGYNWARGEVGVRGREFVPVEALAWERSETALLHERAEELLAVGSEIPPTWVLAGLGSGNVRRLPSGDRTVCQLFSRNCRHHQQVVPGWT